MKCIICDGSLRCLYKDLYDDRYGAPGKFDIYKCQSCGFARIRPEILKKNLSNFYEKYYPLSSVSSNEVVNSANPYLSIKDFILGTNNVCHKYAVKGQTVLDVGSGSGQSVYELKLKGCEGFGI